jgi:hypothetical protein
MLFLQTGARRTGTVDIPRQSDIETDSETKAQGPHQPTLETD